MSNKLITESFTKVKKSSSRPLQHKGKAAQPKAGPSVTVVKKDETIQLSQYELDIKMLKQFDLDWRYGPCTGITRLERWNRADKHRLEPPNEVRDLIEHHSEDQAYTKGVWNDYEL